MAGSFKNFDWAGARQCIYYMPGIAHMAKLIALCVICGPDCRRA